MAAESWQRPLVPQRATMLHQQLDQDGSQLTQLPFNLCASASATASAHPTPPALSPLLSFVPTPLLALVAAMTLAEAVGRALGLKYWEDLRTLFLTGCYFVLFAALWFSWKAVWAAGWMSVYAPLFFIGWLCLCYLSFLGSVATHNCIHCPMFFVRWRNRAFQIALTLVYGHPVTKVKIGRAHV